VQYQSVVEGFLLLKNAGAQKLGVLTEPVELDQG